MGVEVPEAARAGFGVGMAVVDVLVQESEVNSASFLAFVARKPGCCGAWQDQV